jgi:cyclin-dependent kinase regulatory subunit CKS1
LKILINLNFKLQTHMPHFPDEIEYSEKYQDENFEYRHVLLPKHIHKKAPRSRLLTEHEWRALGVQ